jgi:hypothetical protein
VQAVGAEPGGAGLGVLIVRAEPGGAGLGVLIVRAEPGVRSSAC